MSNFKAKMHQLTVLPQTVYLDLKEPTCKGRKGKGGRGEVTSAFYCRSTPMQCMLLCAAQICSKFSYVLRRFYGLLKYHTGNCSLYCSVFCAQVFSFINFAC